MRYTKEQLIEAIKTSTSYRQVLVKLGLASQGGNNATIKRNIAKYNLDISHFTGQAHNKGKTTIRVPTTIYLNNLQPIGSYRLKNRLIKEGYFIKQCSSCSNTKWLNNPIPLELDHIDGNSSNNNLDNLRLLCPNCHAFTDTYRGKNQERAKKT